MPTLIFHRPDLHHLGTGSNQRVRSAVLQYSGIYGDKSEMGTRVSERLRVSMRGQIHHKNCCRGCFEGFFGLLTESVEKAHYFIQMINIIFMASQRRGQIQAFVFDSGFLVGFTDTAV